MKMKFNVRVLDRVYANSAAVSLPHKRWLWQGEPARVGVKGLPSTFDLPFSELGWNYDDSALNGQLALSHDAMHNRLPCS